MLFNRGGADERKQIKELVAELQASAEPSELLEQELRESVEVHADSLSGTDFVPQKLKNSKLKLEASLVLSHEQCTRFQAQVISRA